MVGSMSGSVWISRYLARIARGRPSRALPQHAPEKSSVDGVGKNSHDEKVERLVHSALAHAMLLPQHLRPLRDGFLGEVLEAVFRWASAGGFPRVVSRGEEVAQ